MNTTLSVCLHKISRKYVDGSHIASSELAIQPGAAKYDEHKTYDEQTAEQRVEPTVESIHEPAAAAEQGLDVTVDNCVCLICSLGFAVNDPPTSAPWYLKRL